MLEDIHKRNSKKVFSDDRFTEGCVVRSVAGRDKDNIFFIFSLEGEYAYLTDGSIHKVESPKKKKLKHLEYCGENPNPKLHGKIVCGVMPENAEIRKALKIFSDKEEVVG